MKASDIAPFIRMAFILTNPPFNKFVRNADCRLFYVLEGSGELTINNETFHVEKDFLGLWRSGIKYRWNFSKSQEVLIAIINFDYTQTYKEKGLIPQSNSVNILETEDFEDITILNEPILINKAVVLKRDVLDMVQEFNTQNIYSEELLSGMLKQLIIKTVRLDNSSLQSHAKLEPILAYIHANYNKELTNQALSKIVNYHPHYINLLMKEYTGTTLHSYLTRYRMLEASKLILNTNKAIEEIAFETGFKNPTHFYKIFKQHFGVSPSQCRKSGLLDSTISKGKKL
ncbi:MAG: helix-turn-helix domain-containing protein [Clostridia bacterium]|nr:helix-turn-helix domain-containing protein [Clostridia bacterium]